MKKSGKKGFTIVELVVVIVVIAILAAVLIPTISNLITKANRSADIQAVYNMNTALTIESTGKNYTSLQDALNALKSAGIDGDHYKALADGYKFVWDSDLNRILYIDKDNNVAYPDEYKDLTFAARKSYWIELSGKRAGDDSWYNADNAGETIANNEYAIGTGENAVKIAVSADTKKYTIKNADQLASFANIVASDDNHGANMVIELEKDATYDMSGAWEGIEDFNGIFNGNGATITNFSITDTSKKVTPSPSWTNNSYEPHAFISYFNGQYFGNVTLDVNIDASSNVTTQNHTVAGVLGYVGAIAEGSKVIIENVTVTGTIRAPFRAAGIVGFVGGSATNRMSGTVTIRNCTNKASVTSYACTSSYNTAAGIVSTTNQLTEKGVFSIENCVNEGAIIGSDVAGILANCFAAYEVGNKDGNPCGTVKITGCKNTGLITAKHSCDTKDFEHISGFSHVNCVYGSQIVAPYGKQARLYVWSNTTTDGKLVIKTGTGNSAQMNKEHHQYELDCRYDGNTNGQNFDGYYKTSDPTSDATVGK